MLLLNGNVGWWWHKPWLLLSIIKRKKSELHFTMQWLHSSLLFFKLANWRGKDENEDATLCTMECFGRLCTWDDFMVMDGWFVRILSKQPTCTTEKNDIRTWLVSVSHLGQLLWVSQRQKRQCSVTKLTLYVNNNLKYWSRIMVRMWDWLGKMMKTDCSLLESKDRLRILHCQLVL